MATLNETLGKARAKIHAREIAKQKRGKVQFKKWMANGHPVDGLSAKLKHGIAVGVTHFGVIVTATYDGVHTPTSWHYQKRAVDFGGPLENLPAWERYLLRHHTNAREIFGPEPRYIKDGVLIEGIAPDNPNHVHWAQ